MPLWSVSGCEHLRRHVSPGSAPRVQPLELHRAVVPDGVLVSKPPINQLDWCPCRRTLDVQHILQLQITVRDASRVRIPHPLDHLHEHAARLALSEPLARHHIVEELATMHGLHDETMARGDVGDVVAVHPDAG